MIIAIDGPAGAGKSTTARAVAEHFGFAYIDTGAMYRAVALSALERELSASDDARVIGELARALPLMLRDNGRRVLLEENETARDISDAIRAPHVAEAASQVAALPDVRTAMVEQQRRLAHAGVETQGGAVLEGRDIQTVVFPNAPVKIFLTADLNTRAARRLDDWRKAGEAMETQDAETAVAKRDARDSGREVAPLQPAPDAITIATDNLSLEEVVAQIAQIVRAQMPS